MKKIVKDMWIITITFFCIFFLISSNTYATSISDIFTKADEFITMGQSGTVATISENSMQEMSRLLYNVLLIIGIVIAVILGIIIGIKFMTGSVEEKAKVKETLIAYIAGCVVIFGAFGIWKLMINIFSNI